MRLKEKVLSTMKSTDTESRFELYVTRTPGYLWARLFQKLGVHPIAVTLMSIVIGAVSGYFFYLPSLKMNLIGIFLLIWANWYDCADGQLARMTGKKTLIGRMLDGFSGDIWFFCIDFAICLRLMDQNIPLTDIKWGIWIWLLGALAGFLCHSPQSSLSDYYRQIHLYFLKGKEGSELDNYKQQRRIYEQYKASGNLVGELFFYNYANYCKSQEKRTPKFQRFFSHWLRSDLSKEKRESIRQQFLAGSRPLMPHTNTLTFNTRAICIYITCLLNCPWVYFLFEITILQCLYKYMHRKHETMSEMLDMQLSKNDNTLNDD